MTSKYVHTFVKTFGRGREVLTGFGNFTTWQIAWLKSHFGKTAFFYGGELHYLTIVALKMRYKLKAIERYNVWTGLKF